MLAILNRSVGEVGTGEDGGDGGEAYDGVGGGGIHRILCLIRQIALWYESFVSSSSSPCGGEIKGLVSSTLFPSFL